MQVGNTNTELVEEPVGHDEKIAINSPDHDEMKKTHIGKIEHVIKIHESAINCAEMDFNEVKNRDYSYKRQHNRYKNEIKHIMNSNYSNELIFPTRESESFDSFSTETNKRTVLSNCVAEIVSDEFKERLSHLMKWILSSRSHPSKNFRIGE